MGRSCYASIVLQWETNPIKEVVGQMAAGECAQREANFNNF